MTDAKPALGFIGLGLIGSPMAERLLGAGHRLTVWNRSREKLQKSLALGAHEARSPADVARASEFVFLCVTDDRAVEDIVFGPDGIAGVGRALAGKILIDCSTIKPDAARRLATRLREQTGMRWIDAPVTGGVTGARAGKLVIMAGGEDEDVGRARPVIAAFAQSLTHMGPQGAGLVTKLCNQVIVACSKVVLSEMLLLARDGGIDGARVPEALKGGSADSNQLQREAPRMVRRDFAPHGTANTILKDLDIIADFAKTAGTPMPVTGLVNALYRLHIARGGGDRDSTSIFELLSEQANS